MDWVSLFYQFGWGVFLIGIIVLFGRQLIEYIFNNLIETKKNQLSESIEFLKGTMRDQEEESKQQFELSKLQINQVYQNDLNVSLNKLQIETLKVNRVLPLLEELSNTINELDKLLRMNLNALYNKGDATVYQTKRSEVHTKLFELTGKLRLYMPREINCLLEHLNLLASNSFHSGVVYYDDNFLKLYKLESKHKLFKDASIYLDRYFNAFYDMVSVYIQRVNVQIKEDPEIIEALENNGISIADFTLSDTNLLTNLIESQILLTAYRKYSEK